MFIKYQTISNLYGCCFPLQLSNLIANVTVALALAILLAYSLVGLADHGPGEGIQLAGEVLLFEIGRRWQELMCAYVYRYILLGDCVLGVTHTAHTSTYMLP